MQNLAIKLKIMRERRISSRFFKLGKVSTSASQHFLGVEHIKHLFKSSFSLSIVFVASQRNVA